MAKRTIDPSKSLAARFPEIAAQWHPTKNGDLTPADVASGSHKKFWWKCDVADDHEWQANANSRTSKRSGCPCCAGQQVSATNSLATQFPEVAAQWHPVKNGSLTPTDVVAGSNKKFWWKCDVADDHEWQTSAGSRTAAGQGCPSCVGQQVSVTNSLATQFPEVAAQWHPTKNGDLMPAGIVAGSSKKFWWKCGVADDHEWKTSASSRTAAGLGCPCCAGKQLSVTNSLADRYPNLAAGWHSTKNGNLTPSDVIAGSHKKFWWRCNNAADHEWQATPSNRTHKKTPSGCPFCTNRQLSVTNSLEKRFPEVSAQWHPTKNGDLKPADVIASTHRKFWWKCDVAADHEWQATGNSRTSGLFTGCPFCAGKQVSVTNSLATQFPEVAAQWHPTKNGDLMPAGIVAGSHKKFWWKCGVADDHEWQAVMKNRAHGSGCPDCTLTPRSAQEMFLAHELLDLLDFDADAHKVRLGGRALDVDILINDLRLAIEFDGAYWHRNKSEKDSVKTAKLEGAGWQVIRVREAPLASIHANDVMVRPLMPAKQVADLVLTKIEQVTGTEIPGLDRYLSSDLPRKEKEAKAAIRAYQAERAEKKAKLAAKKAEHAASTPSTKKKRQSE